MKALDIGMRCHRLRLFLGYSREHVGELGGVSAVVVMRYEKGLSVVPAWYVRLLEDCLPPGVSMSGWLLHGASA